MVVDAPGGGAAWGVSATVTVTGGDGAATGPDIRGADSAGSDEMGGGAAAGNGEGAAGMLVLDD